MIGVAVVDGGEGALEDEAVGVELWGIEGAWGEEQVGGGGLDEGEVAWAAAAPDGEVGGDAALVEEGEGSGGLALVVEGEGAVGSRGGGIVDEGDEGRGEVGVD